MSFQIANLQSEIQNQRRWLRDAQDAAKRHARAADNARQKAQQLQQALTQANEKYQFQKAFSDEQLDTIKYLAARSAEPGNEGLREFSFKLYLLELCGAPYEQGLRGCGGYHWLDSLRMGLYRTPARALNREEMRLINLKLMVRAEFYTFAKITKKLNAFQGKVLEALTFGSDEYPQLRDPRLVEVVVREVKAHNEWIAQLEGAEEGDLRLQHDWEAERLAWWKENAAYLEATHTVPLFKAMLKENPAIRVDDFHAAGRIARDAGWHINRMEPSKYYTANTVAAFWDAPHSFCPQEVML
ncbi:hypothetical protein [Thalassolituus marinus]|uniref:Uncharacterized protein n=1 Tax=Thalassolituus marinus TaxID=671053 RepID=A0ABS7ZN11_9GAMM|nr:hypothetical protein [Thalassolituus marinus]MCA6063096.1 hypothetical protein [Thalassolituus marinus]